MKYRVLLIAIILASCGNGNNRETSNKTEQSPQAKNTDVQPNNIVKGRYQCYRLSSAGDEVTSDLYILPGNKYQVDMLQVLSVMMRNRKGSSGKAVLFINPVRIGKEYLQKREMLLAKAGMLLIH